MTERSGDVDDFGWTSRPLAPRASLLEFLRRPLLAGGCRGHRELPRTGPVPVRGEPLGPAALRRADALPSGGGGDLGARRPRFLVADWLITLPFVQPLPRAPRRRAGLPRERRSAAAHRPLGDRLSRGREGRGQGLPRALSAEALRPGRRGARGDREAGVPLVPVGMVGAEEAHPILFKSSASARIGVCRSFRSRPTFPLLGPLGLLPLPTKWVDSLRRADRDSAHRRCGKAAAAMALLVSRITEELRGQEIQALVDAGSPRARSVWG